MRAVVYSEYGPPEVLRLEEIPTPVPGDDEVLVQVCAASVNAADWRLMRADPFLARLHAGLFAPKKYPVLGADVAGRVEAVGRGVRRFRPGDEVIGDVFESGLGGFAEYARVKESDLVPKPANVSFVEAAAVPLAGRTALHALRDFGRVRAGQKVLIAGASGGVGTFAVQLAKHFGAEVTAVCSTRKVELLRSLGADHVIDYTREDFARLEQRYDVILGVNGFRSLFDYRRALSPGGRYAMVGGSTAQMVQAVFFGPWLSLIGSRKFLAVSSKPNQADLRLLAELLAAGQLEPVIDRRYPLEETREAVRYVEEGHATGKVVVAVR